MAVKDILMKFGQALLCCGKRERKLKIGSPTDVRRVDVSDAIPGLTDAERKYIREKASSDAIHLLGLQSHPPSHPPTSRPSPTSSRSTSVEPTFIMLSREPSEVLLNAASKDLPSTLPTPPRRVHNENSPPAARMKTMRENSRRLSKSSSCHDDLYADLEEAKGNESEKGPSDSFMTLNLEFDFEEKKSRSDSPRMLSLTDGFEMQDTKGGHSEVTTPSKKDRLIERAIKTTALGDSSDSEDDTFVSRETKPLVNV
ncbi:hypothetical protein BKA66DRAFT_199599 [Pyrenochaeta sp. MPI-SDFR-AT-0127]|nr:hypothetical protein BKA66DRAFT_199599 [Pyrenochaeta sp. MPI-SDFR-AT-0127]